MKTEENILEDSLLLLLAQTLSLLREEIQSAVKANNLAPMDICLNASINAKEFLEGKPVLKIAVFFPQDKHVVTMTSGTSIAELRKALQSELHTYIAREEGQGGHENN